MGYVPPNHFGRQFTSEWHLQGQTLTLASHRLRWRAPCVGKECRDDGIAPKMVLGVGEFLDQAASFVQLVVPTATMEDHFAVSAPEMQSRIQRWWSCLRTAGREYRLAKCARILWAEVTKAEVTNWQRTALHKGWITSDTWEDTKYNASVSRSFLCAVRSIKLANLAAVFVQTRGYAYRFLLGIYLNIRARNFWVHIAKPSHEQCTGTKLDVFTLGQHCRVYNVLDFSCQQQVRKKLFLSLFFCLGISVSLSLSLSVFLLCNSACVCV